MDKIRLGFIGIGQRGRGLLDASLRLFPDVDVTSVCDAYADRTENAVKMIKELRNFDAKGYDNYELLLKDDNVNTVIISASWEDHIPLAIASMRAGKVTGLEVGGAYSLHDCYELVKAYEETKTPFMFLENCCYNSEELTVTNMVRKGLFGEIAYCHGSYCHDLAYEIIGGIKNRHYRLRNYLMRNCDNYPTHNLGPIAKLLNINRGNRILSLSSFSSKSVGLNEYINNHDEYSDMKNLKFNQGDVVFTNISCADGTLITLKLSTSLMNYYSREFTVNGTKGFYAYNGNVLAIKDSYKGDDTPFNDHLNSAKEFMEKYTPSIIKNMTEEQLNAGHGGMDALELAEFFKHTLSGEEMPIDVYDAATWMAITCLSEKSLSLGGTPVEMPDFTCGKWVMREPKDVLPLD